MPSTEGVTCKLCIFKFNFLNIQLTSFLELEQYISLVSLSPVSYRMVSYERTLVNIISNAHLSKVSKHLTIKIITFIVFVARCHIGLLI